MEAGLLFELVFELVFKDTQPYNKSLHRNRFLVEAFSLFDE